MNSHSSSSSELPPLPETLDVSSSTHLVPVFSTLAGDSFYSPTRALSPPPPPPPPSLTIDDNGNIYAGVVDEDALKVVPGRDHSFQLLIDDPSSAPLYVLPPAGNQFGPVFSSRVTAVAPPDVLNPEPVCDLSWLFTNNSSSKNRISATPATSPPEAAPCGIGAGLVNLGNTCYLNSILQCFTHTVPLVQGLLTCGHSAPCDRHVRGFCVLCALSDHVDSSLVLSGQSLSPSKLVDNLSYFSSLFTKYQQEDAHEFMQLALDRLEGCFLNLKKNDMSVEDDNLVKKVFGGRLISKLRCCNCCHSSDTYEPLIDISLEIGNADSLSSALESFTMVENIDAKFNCDGCKEEVSKEKQLMLDETPAVATFHLKRFKSDGTSVQKIDKHVDFPLELDLTPYTLSGEKNDAPLKYDLYAIVVHNGVSYTSGHYFCFVRSAPDTWHKMDDSKVTKVSENSVLSEEAYILFYARQGTPWFSSVFESLRPYLKPSIMNTSPKSVLDSVANSDKSNAIVEGGATNESDPFSKNLLDMSCHEVLEINDTSDAPHDCGYSVGPNSATLDSIVMPNRNSSIEIDALVQNNVCAEVSEENAAFHPLTPPCSPSNAADNIFPISHDHLKKENHGSCKRPSNNLSGGSERQVAERYISKMSGARKAAFMKFFPQSESPSDKKRKKVDSLQCKKDESSVSKKSNRVSVSHPVTAGTSK